MEVISFHVGIISRREGRSSVQMAAYCSRSKLLDERTGETYSYAGRSDLVHHEVMLPDHAPNEFYSSEVVQGLKIEVVFLGRSAWSNLQSNGEMFAEQFPDDKQTAAI